MIMNKAAVYIYLQVFMLSFVLVSLGQILKGAIAKPYDKSVFRFQETFFQSDCTI